MSSFSMFLTPSASHCRNPIGPTRFGPMRLCMRAMTRRSTQVVMPAIGSTNPNTMSAANTRMASNWWPQAGIAAGAAPLSTRPRTRDSRDG